MQTAVGVRFKRAGKIYDFDPSDLALQVGDEVIAETSRGLEYGHVIIAPREIEPKAGVPLRPVLRLATDDDRKTVAINREKEQEAFEICSEKIAAHGLPMKLVGVEYTFDINKIVFYFTADGRIDFRELVKDLAAVFRTRIELRQIGVRDEAKMMGGIGCCGRPLCCATFLEEFVPVSIRMAKEQSLSLNPAKISGICGRLMCCLKYENDCYASRNRERRKILPPAQGSRVATAEGDGKVISLNEQRRTATILLDSGKTMVASWEDVVERDDEGVTPEEMAAAIAVATMLNEREQAAKAAANAERQQRQKEQQRERSGRSEKKFRREKLEGNRPPKPKKAAPLHRPKDKGERRPKPERKERRRPSAPPPEQNE